MYPSPIVIAEIWALAGTIQMITVQSHRRHPSILCFQSGECSLLNPLVKVIRKPHWGFCPIFPPLRSSLPFLFFCCTVFKMRTMKQKCFVPSKSPALFLILIHLTLLLPFHFFPQQASLITVLFLVYVFLIWSWHFYFDVFWLSYKI